MIRNKLVHIYAAKINYIFAINTRRRHEKHIWRSLDTEVTVQP